MVLKKITFFLSRIVWSIEPICFLYFSPHVLPMELKLQVLVSRRDVFVVWECSKGAYNSVLHVAFYFSGFLTENLQAHHEVSWLQLQTILVTVTIHLYKIPARTQSVFSPQYHSLRLNPQESPRALWMGELKGKGDGFFWQELCKHR